MMQIAPRAFPPNPNVGDQYTAPDGRVFEWNGDSWVVVSSGGTAGARYLYTQSPADTDWVISHNLNFRYVHVQVVDTAGNTVIPDVDYFSNIRVDLIFSNPVAGTAIIRS